MTDCHSVPTLKLSIGTAAALGLATVKTRKDSLPTTAYLMDPGGKCLHNCSFCAQARTASSDDSLLSRIIWKEYPIEKVMAALKNAVAEGQIKRTCVQVTLNKGSYERTKAIVRAVTEAVDVPMSVSTNISNAEQVEELLALGAARVSIALDAATEELHNAVKNTGWQFKIDLLTRMAAKYPGRITTHFIVGLGESEWDVLKAIDTMYGRQVTVGLFAFTPVKGTAMADCPPPQAGPWRRVQLANWLLKHKVAAFEDLQFDDAGHLTGLGSKTEEALRAAADGAPFRTAGCDHCNRPYYNESAGHGVMYNYPRPLKRAEALQALEETGLFSPELLGDLKEEQA